MINEDGVRNPITTPTYQRREKPLIMKRKGNWVCVYGLAIGEGNSIQDAWRRCRTEAMEMEMRRMRWRGKL